jgi:hypothetical protein
MFPQRTRASRAPRPPALSTQLKNAFEEVVTGRGWLTNLRGANEHLPALTSLTPPATVEEVQAATQMVMDTIRAREGETAVVYLDRIPAAVKALRARRSAENRELRAEDHVLRPQYAACRTEDLPDDIDTTGLLGEEDL